MSEPKGLPEKIFLQIGDDEDFSDADFERLRDSGEVTWNDERIYTHDIEYTRSRPSAQGGEVEAFKIQGLQNWSRRIMQGLTVLGNTVNPECGYLVSDLKLDVDKLDQALTALRQSSPWIAVEKSARRVIEWGNRDCECVHAMDGMDYAEQCWGCQAISELEASLPTRKE